MKKSNIVQSAAALLLAVSMFGFAGCSNKTSSSSKQTTVYGKVTAISGTKITIALGTMNQRGGNQQDVPFDNNSMPPQWNESQGTSMETPPQRNTSQGNTSRGNTSQGTGSQGASPKGNSANRTFDMLTLTGKSKTITITDTGIITKMTMQGFGGGRQTANAQSGTGSAGASSAGASSTGTSTAVISGNDAATLSDIVVGSILQVTYITSSEKLVSVKIISISQPG